MVGADVRGVKGAPVDKGATRAWADQRPREYIFRS